MQILVDAYQSESGLRIAILPSLAVAGSITRQRVLNPGFVIVDMSRIVT